MTLRPALRPALFACLFGAVLVVEWWAAGLAARSGAAVLPAAIVLDLVLTVPAAFYFLVLRPAGRRLADAGPVVVAGGLVATFLLHPIPSAKALLLWGGGAAEMATLALLVARLRAGARQMRKSAAQPDLLERVHALGDPLLRFLGSEIVVVYYAFFARRREPLAPNEFTYTENTSAGAVLGVLAFLVLVESLVTHLILSGWSPTAAWVLTALSAYTLLWMKAIHSAARLRTVQLLPARLLVRTSLLWTAEVPLDAIRTATPASDQPLDRTTLKAALLETPNVLISLTCAVEAHGPLGIRREFRRIALHVDEPERLLAALSE